MTEKRQRRHYLPELIFLTLCCASACGDDDGGSSGTRTNTDSNQPSGGGGGGMSGAGSTAEAPAAGGSMNSGVAGTNGAGEAPGMGATLGDMGAMAGANAGASGSTGMDPACRSDVDVDGVNDCLDGCPMDANKVAPGVCGCGVLDSDVDFDGTLDCQETCPADPAKTAPGLCGCGRPDVDTDADGMLDCNDGCPQDATRTAPGTCGCGVADNLPLCLRHRYSFNGMGAVATDGVGDADGDIIGTTLTGTGSLVLAGVATDQYVNLPAGIISALGANATIETWVTWTGQGGAWQRIFDFGSSEQPAGTQGAGVTYLFVTPSNTINTHLRVAYTNSGPPNERVVNGLTSMPFTVPVHVAVVIDGAASTLALYQNGAAVDVPAPTLDTTLALMNDINNWIGRSQFVADEEFQGVIDEFRIYSAARSAAQVAADFTAGPNALPAQ